MTLPIIAVAIGLILVLIPNKYLTIIVRKFLKNFGISLETKKVNLTKLVTEIIRLTGAVLIGVGLIVFFVLPYYSLI